MGLPYVLSSDLVSAYPAKSLSIAEYVDGQIPLLAMTQNAQTGVSYSFVLTDFTKLVTISNAGAVAVTLPLESSVAWPAGTQLRILNVGAGTVTVAGAAGVTINGSPLTLAQYKGANLIKTGTNTWVFIPFASGIGAAVYSDANSGTYTGYAYKTFTSSSTLTVTTAGFADLIVLAGGAGGSTNTATAGGGGGAGGALVVTGAYLEVGTLTVVVGAGGATSTNTFNSKQGNSSRVGSYYGIGGGSAGGRDNGVASGFPGGCGGGGAGSDSQALPLGGSGMSGQGFDGGIGIFNGAGGGGGGTSAVGVAAVANVGGNGGAGSTTTIAGTTPSGAYVAGSYAFGGGGGGGGNGSTAGTGGSGGGGAGATGAATATAGSANTGGGGGGSDAGLGNSGGSGIVIVRVAV